MTAYHPVPGFDGPGRLLRLGADGRGVPVLLTHGTFSDAETCLPLAAFLSETGRSVYVIEWRGRNGRPGSFDFHDLAEGEIAAAFRALPDSMHLVAHSGGGLAMSFALLEPAVRRRVRSLTLLATQGTHLTEAPHHSYLGIVAMERWGRLRGHWPARLLGLGRANESAHLLSQWVAFNRTRRILCRDGADLFPRLTMLDLPVLGLAGAADHIIARPEGCRALAEAFGSSAQFHICSVQEDGEDFTHSRLIRSRMAAAHVWPRIARFQRDIDADAPDA